MLRTNQKHAFYRNSNLTAFLAMGRRRHFASVVFVFGGVLYFDFDLIHDEESLSYNRC